MSNCITWKDVLYFMSFLIGLITFIKTFRKKEYCSLDYKTEYGDETNLYIFAIKDDLYNLKILSENQKLKAIKYTDLNISKLKHERNSKSGDKSLYFPRIEKNDVIEIRDAKDLGKIKFEYEDKYSNKYYQFIHFDYKTDKTFNSKRYYKMSKRKAKSFWKRII